MDLTYENSVLRDETSLLEEGESEVETSSEEMECLCCCCRGTCSDSLAYFDEDPYYLENEVVEDVSDPIPEGFETPGRGEADPSLTRLKHPAQKSWLSLEWGSALQRRVLKAGSRKRARRNGKLILREELRAA